MSIGEDLATARRQADLTVDQVSQRTRIRATIIVGIEDDDYSACGGDFYARGHIRAIASAVGLRPEPLIREYDAARQEEEEETGAEADTAPIRAVRSAQSYRLALALVGGLVLAALLGFAAYRLLAGPGPRPAAAASASPRPTHDPRPGRSTPAPPKSSAPASSAPASSSPPAAPLISLTPASAAGFNPYGSGSGQGSGDAHLAIDGSAGTAWHTDWYTSPRFGGLYSGTGLLLDMGHPVTIASARVTLGAAHGADFELRVGNKPSLAGLPSAASASGAGGVTRLSLRTPARGRYVLIWFTRLPPDSTGTYQASVYGLQLKGRS